MGRSLGHTRPEPDGDAHLGLQRPQVEQVEVTGQRSGQGMKRAQAGARELPLGYGQGEHWGVQVHGGQVAEEGRVAGGAAILDLRGGPEMHVRGTVNARPGQFLREELPRCVWEAPGAFT